MTITGPQNYIFWWPDKCQGDKCQATCQHMARGTSARGTSAREDKCQGDKCQGGQVPGGQVPGHGTCPTGTCQGVTCLLTCVATFMGKKIISRVAVAPIPTLYPIPTHGRWLPRNDMITLKAGILYFTCRGDNKDSKSHKSHRCHNDSLACDMIHLGHLS